MRILFVSPTARAGTAQYTHNLMNALADRGHQIGLATGVGYELAEFPRRYQLLEVIDRYRPRPRRLRDLSELLRRMRPEIIHYQGAQRPATYLVAWLALRLLSSARFVYTPQDILPFSERSHNIRTLRLFYRRMAHVFLNAHQNLAVAVRLFGVNPANVTVLPMPDLLAFLRDAMASVKPPVPDGRRLILLFGQIQKRKGVDLLIEAFAKVVRSVPDAHLAIAGKPYTDIAPLRHQIDRLGIEDRVTLQPIYVTLAEMAGYFERAYVIALPYRSGWNSGVLASAFGYRKPVVATRVGGFHEVVRHEYNGLLVAPEDVTALSQALSRSLTDTDLYRRLCAGAAKTAEIHSWARVAELTEQRYRAVLGLPQSDSLSITVPEQA